MQCPNCQFENMPGTMHCARCSMSMQMGAAVLSIEPPRAGAWRKRLRRHIRYRQGYYRVRDAGVTALHSVGHELTRRTHIFLPTTGVLLRMIVPGWAHFHLGHRARGHLLLSCYLLMLLMSLVTFGSTLSGVALGLLFAVHTAAVIDLLMHTDESATGRFLFTAGIMAVLFFVLYAPAGYFVTSIVGARQIRQSAPPFEAGDVVVFNPRAYRSESPSVGDVVVYWMNGTSGPGYMRQAGESIDRIVAGPGSVMRWENGRLTVDGKLAEVLPLNPAGIPSGMTAEVPPGHYGILPSTGNWRGMAADPRLWTDACTVPKNMIRGKVYLRHYPWSRWSWL